MKESKSHQLHVFWIACLHLFMCPCAHANEISNTKDGIQLDARLEIGADGKSKIICILFNKSNHILASYNKITRSSEFQINLLDGEGARIPQESKWAEEYVQKDSKRFRDPRSSGVEECIEPGTKVEFEFDLEDAYGARMTMGRSLNLSWESLWLQGTAESTERRNAEGKIVPRYVEKYFFPSRWNISVTLPLPKKTGEDVPPPAIDPKVLTPPPKDLLPKVDAIKPQSAVARTPANEVMNSTPWWWALLLIPLLLIARLLMRPRNNT